MPTLVASRAGVAAAGASVWAAALAGPENALVRNDLATCDGVSADLAGSSATTTVLLPDQSNAPATPTTAVVASAPLIRIHLRVFGSTVEVPPGKCFPRWENNGAERPNPEDFYLS